MALSIDGQYIWDFWYTYMAETRLFTVYFLHADRRFVADNQHHFHSAVGVCKTLDWVNFFDHRLRVLQASDNMWANTSIWTGDAIQRGNDQVVFYTSRDKSEFDGMTQSIGVSYAYADGRLEISPAKITTPPGPYWWESDPLESSIHCWRDPCVFESGGQVYMLVAAKRRGGMVNHRGCIALLKLENRDDLSRWEHIGVIVSTSYAEVELPQIYRDDNGKFRIFFNANSADGSDHYVVTDEFVFGNSDTKVNQLVDISKDIPWHQRYYGFRMIPEHNFAICAFHKAIGRVEVVGNLGFLPGLQSIKPQF